MEKPLCVRRAQLNLNQGALSAMGSRGGRATAKKRRREQEEKEIQEFALAELELAVAGEIQQMALERRDHLIPDDDK